MSSFAARLLLALEARGKSPAELARAVPTTESTVSQWLSGQIKSMRGGNLIGTCTFLRINPPWLATGKGPSGLEEEGARAELIPYAGHDDHVIRQYEVRGSMGRGLILEAEPPGTIKSWRVDPEWLRLNVPHHTGVQNLCIVTGFGPSMRGMFNPGDPLLCDTGVNRVDTDGVYFFRVDDHGFIKILQRIPTENGVVLRAKSKNPDYESFDITGKVVASEGFEVIGKILTVWKSEIH